MHIYVTFTVFQMLYRKIKQPATDEPVIACV